MPQPVAFSDLTGTVEMNSKGRLSFETSFYVPAPATPPSVWFVHGRPPCLMPPPSPAGWGSFETVLDALLARPETPAGQLPLLTESERASLLRAFPTDKVVPSDNCCLHTFV